MISEFLMCQLSPKNIHPKLTAATVVYSKCIYIKAFETFMAGFDRENNFTPSLA